MSNLINWLLIVIITLIAVGTTLLAVFIPRKPVGPLLACTPDKVLVNGECKVPQNSPCNQTSDCLQNLKCEQNFCTNNTDLPTVESPVLKQEAVVKPFTTININEIVPRSPEINSTGQEERGFAIHSAETPPPVENEISTPYQENNGYLIPKGNRREGDVQVLDACSYSNGTVFLLANGKVIFEYLQKGKVQRKLISLNLKLSRIVTFTGYIYGLFNQKLYYCENSDPDSGHWDFTPVYWSNLPTGIVHLGSTYDGKNLIVQTRDNGYVFNSRSEILAIYNAVDTIRIYGKDNFIYAELDTRRNTARVYPSGEKFTNVSDLAFDYHGKIVTVPTELRKDYHRIAMVNWKPMFI